MKLNFLDMFKPYKKDIIISLLLIFLFEAINLVNPLIFKELIDLLILFDNTKLNKMILLAGVMFGIHVTASIFYYFESKYIFKSIYKIEKEIKEKVHRKLLTLPISYHEKRNIGGEISKIQRGMDRMIELFYSMLFDFFPVCFKIIVSTIILLSVNLKLAAIFVFFIPLFVFISYQHDRKLQPLRKKINTMDEETYAKMGENVENIRTVQSFSQENREIEEFEIMQRSLFETAKFRINLFLKHNFFRNMILNFGRIFCLAYGLYLAHLGQISPGSFVMFLTISETVYLSLYHFSRSINNISDNAESVRRINALLKEDMKIKQIARPIKRKLDGMVDFRDVSFSYSSKSPVLKDISFVAEKGKTLAIVGPSGGGKSTIIKLLYRHFDAGKGKILVDGIDITYYNLVNFRWQMAIVPQEVELFNTTIKNNISYSKPMVSDEQIIDAAKMSHVHEFVKNMPKGYDTLVGEKGLKLSGGQRQRIGIARALIVEPAILVFDEATSSLDSVSEKAIQRAIKDISGKCTMIIIAHRLSTIKNADKIIVIDDGRIVEEGNHKTLSAKKDSLYNKLYKG
ncbi:MAG: ABC transporter ATP-binding protein [Candidatus Aenigmarchaeota archaeon]|nr:ABC transporter ATP-binding protein [Candidatus Aenigmarchaeota archaeon]